MPETADDPSPSDPQAVGRLSWKAVTTWLIAINVAVFILDRLMYMSGIHGQIWLTPQLYRPALPLETLGSFTVADFAYRLQLWRLLSFQFLHANLTHLIFNMFALYMFGPLVEAFLGRVRYLMFYLLCGVGGPACYMVLFVLNQLGQGASTPLVGASAGIFGILVAAAVLAPDAMVLLYGIAPVRLRTMAWVLLAAAAYTVIAYGQAGRNNAGGQAAHLGGAAVGWLLIQLALIQRKSAARTR